MLWIVCIWQFCLLFNFYFSHFKKKTKKLTSYFIFINFNFFFAQTQTSNTNSPTRVTQSKNTSSKSYYLQFYKWFSPWAIAARSAVNLNNYPKKSPDLMAIKGIKTMIKKQKMLGNPCSCRTSCFQESSHRTNFLNLHFASALSSKRNIHLKDNPSRAAVRAKHHEAKHFI